MKAIFTNFSDNKFQEILKNGLTIEELHQVRGGGGGDVEPKPILD